MRFFDGPLSKLPAFRAVHEGLTEGTGPWQLSGTVESERAHIMSKAGVSDTRLIVTYDELQARTLLEDLQFFSKNALLFPGKDLLFYQADMKSREIIRGRMRVLRRLLERDEEPLLIVTSVQALLNPLIPLSEFGDRLITLAEGLTVEIAALTHLLPELGYERVTKVENPGEFAVHGGILDIFDLTEELPWRIEFWDTEIDTIRTFSPESQLTVERVTEVTVFPAAELILDEKKLLDGWERIEKEGKKNLDLFKKQGNYEAGAALQALLLDVKDGVEDRSLNGVLERFLPSFFPETGMLTDYLPGDALIFLEEPQRIEEYGNASSAEFKESFTERLAKGLALPSQAGLIFDIDACFARLDTPRTLAFTGFDTRVTSVKIRQSAHIDAQSMISFKGNFPGLTQELKRLRALKYSVVLLVASGTRGSRMAEELRGYELSAYYSDDPNEEVKPGTLLVTRGSLHRGFLYHELRYAVLTEGDIFGTEKKRKKAKSEYRGDRIRSFADLAVGDYVVHENYGIGIYKGIVNLTAEDVARDYMEISYGTSGTLYIPVTNLDVVQKYASADAKPPRLNRLDSPDWKKTKGRVKAAVEEVADELVALYAARQNGSGHVFGPDTVWQKEFEEMFPFEETADQITAIEDTKKDMESGKIMDRLICGDVGFGKTEVAIRAAFKAVQESKQVAYLVPTTILAQQHYNTFRQRLQDFPVTVELLSRFRTPSEQEKTIAGLKSGKVDIVIGTHRLLSKDVAFKDLGLLIVDEEQRFGVTHKEKIKQLRTNVDVLTLTATPIPRTLHMSMIGVRDMSVLEEPPTDRRAIQTYVMEYSEELIREAISREIARGGQVYYVYNRVQDIDDVAARVQSLLPEAVVAYAHGKMPERELEKRMLSFIEGEIDVLVSTTIIETGLDIPNVNTIIVHDAERYGLSQLYQLRGRVGRSNRQAYAFIMYRKNRQPTEEAQKRLEAIRQFTELGSGIKIAMEDLEIRGAGTLLGNAQSGHMMLVGYDLYCKLLSEAVKQKKGEDTGTEDIDTLLDVKVDAYIPSTYIAAESLKLEVYKKISFLTTEEERLNLEEELTDRYGTVPKPVLDLMRVSLLRAMAREIYITEIKGNGMELTYRFAADARLNTEALPGLLQRMNGAMRFLPGENPGILYRHLNVRDGGKVPVLDFVEEGLLLLRGAFTNNS